MRNIAVVEQVVLGNLDDVDAEGSLALDDGFDGIALYGRYLPSYPDMVGYPASNTAASSSTPVTGNDLDAYGGHTHLIDGGLSRSLGVQRKR